MNANDKLAVVARDLASIHEMLVRARNTLPRSGDTLLACEQIEACLLRVDALDFLLDGKGVSESPVDAE
jgi:hypothetical protein